VARQALGLPVGSWIVIGAFTLSGFAHLINPTGFLFLMPPWLPEPILLIYLSGVAELLAAAGLVLKTNWGRYLTVATLLAVWPANWWFALDALQVDPVLAVVAWLRLPLQIPLIIWALKSPIKADS
jgi:uncharacterized membrane protein